MSKRTKTKTRTQVAQEVVWALSDKLGGEGWEHPGIVACVEKWVSFPLGEDPAVVDPFAEADALLEQSFDPRDLVDPITV